MEFWLLVVIGVLLIIILGLLIKLLLVQKTARENTRGICRAANDRNQYAD